MDPSRSPFHVLLRATMARSKLTTGGLARATGVSFPAVQKIVGGAMPGRLSTIAAFAKFLEIDPHEVHRLMAEARVEPSRPIAPENGDQPDVVVSDGDAASAAVPSAPRDAGGTVGKLGVQQSLFNSGVESPGCREDRSEPPSISESKSRR